jgi:penicillin-binding protein 1A
VGLAFASLVKKNTPKKTSPGKGKILGWNHLHLSFFLLAIAFLLNLFLGTLLYLLYDLNLPDIKALQNYRPPLATVVLDNQGRELASFARENRILISLDQMPVLLPKAFVAAEDGRFFQHGGVDGWSVLRAMFNNLRSGRRAQGGSTITQQVARALLLTPEKTYSRKLREALLAYRIDRLLSKENILYLYLNQIYLGEGAYGVEAAARTFFGKKAIQLNLAEISLLAGLPQAPSRYSPLNDYRKAKERQRYVLNRMAEDGYITPDEARHAFQRAIHWRQDQPGGGADKYFVEQLRQYVGKKYGSVQLLTGGLTIHATVDSTLQELASDAVAQGILAWSRRNPERGADLPQGALVAMEAATGRVLALVGGTDFRDSQFNRAVQAKRQPGSAFKPIIYAAALNRSFSPADLINDEPLQLTGVAGEVWRPGNFDGRFIGPTTVWNGLVQSRNIVTIKLLQEVGIEPVRQLAHGLGIVSPLADNYTLALGTSEVSLLELTNAYGAFANGGMYRPPIFIDRIVDRHGRILEQSGQQAVARILLPRTAYQVTNLLQAVIRQGTGRLAQGVAGESAGKTGTSDHNFDAWFIGYTPALVAGVWLGFDRQSSLGESETGGRAAAPVWRDFMAEATCLRLADPREFPVPTGIVLLPMDPQSGEIGAATAGHQTVATAFHRDL